MMDIANFCPIEAKRQAKAEIEGYRERVRLEKAAKERADETAEQELAREIRLRRQDEAERDAIRAERQRIMALREVELAAHAKAERERRAAVNPFMTNTQTPARRLANNIRVALGGGFDDFLAELRTIAPQQLFLELRRIPGDERAEVLALEESIRAAAITVPEPMDEQERLILSKFGLDA